MKRRKKRVKKHLTEAQRVHIMGLYAIGEKVIVTASEFGVNDRTIRRMARAFHMPARSIGRPRINP